MSEEINVDERAQFCIFSTLDPEVITKSPALNTTSSSTCLDDNPGSLQDWELHNATKHDSKYPLIKTQDDDVCNQPNVTDKESDINSGEREMPINECDVMTKQGNVCEGQGDENVFEDRFKIDRQKLEELLQSDKTGEIAEEFFNLVMRQTSTSIVWPSKLKIGAKSKKDPHIKISGPQKNVQEAKNLILSKLTTRNLRVTLKMDVPHQCHSHVIGKAGNNIRKVMLETNCHIHFPDSNRNNLIEKSNQVSITGTFPSIEIARRKIRELQPLVFSFDLPAAFTGSHVDVQMFSELLQQRYGISINIRANPHQVGASQKVGNGIVGSTGSTFCVLIRCCAFSAEAAHRAAVDIFDQLTGRPGMAFCVSLSVDISFQHLLAFISSPVVKWIMQVTGTNIHFPDFKNLQDRKMAASPVAVNSCGTGGGTGGNNTTVTVQQCKKTSMQIIGSLPNTVVARKHLLDCLPLTLMMEVPDEINVNQDELTRISTEFDIQIGIKLKPKQATKSVMLKSNEGNVHNMFLSRFVLLDLPKHDLNIFDTRNAFQPIYNCQLNGPQPFVPFAPNPYVDYPKDSCLSNLIINQEQMNISSALITPLNPSPTSLMYPQHYSNHSPMYSVENTRAIVNPKGVNRCMDTQNYAITASLAQTYHNMANFKQADLVYHNNSPNLANFLPIEMNANTQVPIQTLQMYPNYTNSTMYRNSPNLQQDLSLNVGVKYSISPTKYPSSYEAQNFNEDYTRVDAINNSYGNASNLDLYKTAYMYCNGVLQPLKNSGHCNVDENMLNDQRHQRVDFVEGSNYARDNSPQNINHFAPNCSVVNLTNVSTCVENYPSCYDNNSSVKINANLTGINYNYKSVVANSRHNPSLTNDGVIHNNKLIISNALTNTINANNNLNLTHDAKNGEATAIGSYTNHQQIANNAKYVNAINAQTNYVNAINAQTNGDINTKAHTNTGRNNRHIKCDAVNDDPTRKDSDHFNRSITSLIQWLNCQQVGGSGRGGDGRSGVSPLLHSNLDQVQLGSLISPTKKICENEAADVDCGDSMGSSSSGSCKAPGSNRPRKKKKVPTATLR